MFSPPRYWIWESSVLHQLVSQMSTLKVRIFAIHRKSTWNLLPPQNFELVPQDTANFFSPSVHWTSHFQTGSHKPPLTTVPFRSIPNRHLINFSARHISKLMSSKKLSFLLFFFLKDRARTLPGKPCLTLPTHLLPPARQLYIRPARTSANVISKPYWKN